MSPKKLSTKIAQKTVAIAPPKHARHYSPLPLSQTPTATDSLQTDLP